MQPKLILDILSSIQVFFSVINSVIKKKRNIKINLRLGSLCSVCLRDNPELILTGLFEILPFGYIILWYLGIL